MTDLARLVGIVEGAGSKLILVGDDHQLGAVGAGGLFATLVGDRGAAELTTVRRFTHAWERAASLRLRAGDLAILPAYARHGRILGGDRQAVLDTAFDAWSQARAEGRSVVVMAADHDTVDVLALRARAARVAAGEVFPDGITTGRHVVGVSDEVLALRNDRGLITSSGAWVRNGQRWVIDSFAPDGSAVLSSMEGHGAVRIPRTYATEHLALGYATTIHKGQGLTVDEGIVVVDASMSAEALYVGMTRGRTSNRALVICESDDAETGRLVSTAPVELLGRVMRRVGAEASAHKVMRAVLARYDDIGLLAELIEEHNRHLAALAGPDRTKEIGALVPRADVAGARARLASTEGEATRATGVRELAEALVRRIEDPSIAARLPGRLGEGARNRQAGMTQSAESQLRQARSAERAAFAELVAARHGVPEAQRAVEDLALARRGQQRRLDWLGANPLEVGWGDALAERLAQAELSRRLGRRQVLAGGRELEPG